MGRVDKVFAPLVGHPLVSHSVDALERCHLIDRIVVVLGEHGIERGWELVRRFGWSKVSVVAGGHRRQDSVRAGLPPLVDTDWIVVHDGARPLAGDAVFMRVIQAVRDGADAAVPVIDLTDTIRRRDGGAADRSQFVAVQTPQAFRADVLRAAHAAGADATDDATLVEAAGGTVVTVAGDSRNLKITEPHDLVVAEALLGRGERLDTGGGDCG